MAMEKDVKQGSIDSDDRFRAVDQVNGDTQNPEDISFVHPRSLSMDLSRETEHEIQNLAQVFSNMSQASISQNRMINPFHATGDPLLDPFSASFSAEGWAKAYFSVLNHDPETYPHRTAGVAYKDLDVFGYGNDVNYQKDVMNAPLHAASSLRDLFGPKTRVPILTDFDGLIEPGEMCVVLGRPGSGVSTLLKSIAGKTHGLSVGSQASFNYQGISREMMQSCFRGELIYQAETDVHFPHLTVGQTLSFVAQAKAPENRMPGVTRKMHAEHMRDVVMAVLGLSHTLHTKIGDDFVRGVSGGERKRVSIAEVMLSQSPLQCWDNSTRGLDSATALQFIKTLDLASNVTDSTAIVALYQASQEMYDIFDKVAVLYEGRQIYFGSTQTAKNYFTDMGYICAPRQTTADFLTSLTNPSERIVQNGFESKVPRTPDEFAKRWSISQDRKRLLEDIDNFNKQYPIDGSHLERFQTSRKAQQASMTRSRSPYLISIPMQIKLCVMRGSQRLRGEKTFTGITIFGNILISLVLGSIFLDLPNSTESFYGRGALLFVGVLFNALTSALEILPLYTQRLVVEKQVSFALYHPFSEAIASMICELPSKILCTIAFNVPLYLMANLRREAGPFFIYLLFAFSCTLAMSMIFRTTGQLTRTLSQAMGPMALFILALVIYTGFVLPIRSMQSWLRWLNYLNPVAYAFEALMANEFHNREFPCTQFIPRGPAYMNSTGTQRACSVGGGLPGSSSIDGDTYINATYKYYHSHLWRNFGIMVVFILFFMTVYLIAAEKLSFQKSKGEVLIFRQSGNFKSKPKTAKDEESLGQDQHRNEKTISTHEETLGGSTPIRAQTAIFHWKDVCYEVPIKGKPRVILDHVNGWVKPGSLTALMGATGAGKTSLLNALANRVDVGVVSGDILVNGLERPNSFQRQTGYVQQQDVHLPTSTVREALQFSALLRQPASVPKNEKFDYVEKVIKLLEMEAYSDAVVGVAGEGLNVEQRKRLTIGVELAAKPDLLLFLDEPTSGLDSQTAWSITSLIRKLADNGYSILTTIHQPSAVLFQRFDRLLLLAKGGKTVYFGDIGQDSKEMINYFEKHGAQPCGKDRNPAEWMLEVIGAAPGVNANQDWAEVWRNSTELVGVTEHLADLKRPSSDFSTQQSDPTQDELYASPFYFQLGMCLQRALDHSWRDPSYIYSKLGLCTATSLFVGFSFYKGELTLQGVQNQIFSFFMLLIVQVFMAYQAMPNYITQRELYEVRERPARTYSWKAFMASSILVEIPWNSLCALIIFFCVYYPIGMNNNASATDTVTERGGLMFLLIWVFMMFGSTFTNMVVAGAATAEIGAIIAVILFAMSLIFCGVLVHPGDLPGFWTFMYRASPFTYLINSFLSTGLANSAVTCSPIEFVIVDPPVGQTCAQYLFDFMQLVGGSLANPEAIESCKYCSVESTNTLLATVNSFYSERWRNFGLMWVYVVFNACAALFFYWLTRIPKQWRKMAQPFMPKVVEELH